jgi:hypothetical protein
MNNIIASILFISSTGILLAQPTSGSGASSKDLQMNTITTAVPFLSITPDSRVGGMGDAGTALSGNANSVYWNTSMLNFAKNKSEVSLSYTPWLRQLTNDIHLSYLSGYYKLNDRNVIGGSLRYFSLGEITFTDNNATILRTDKPSEFEVTGAYAYLLSDRFSIGLNGKFVYSNLTGGLTVPGVSTKAGVAGATDISFSYYNEDARFFGISGAFTSAATINNIGNKISYSDLENRDFLPMNLKIGNSYRADFDKYNSVTFALDFQKLLVPTPAAFAKINDTVRMISGMNSDVGVISGLVQSFYDAPGVVKKDENGNYVQNPDGTYEVEKNSRIKEELSEINLALGMEYWYNQVLCIRTGVFLENKNKGNRKYLTLGVGLKYNKFGFDLSYLAAFNGKQSPLANTLRYSILYTISGNGKSSPNIE